MWGIVWHGKQYTYDMWLIKVHAPACGTAQAITITVKPHTHLCTYFILNTSFTSTLRSGRMKTDRTIAPSWARFSACCMTIHELKWKILPGTAGVLHPWQPVERPYVHFQAQLPRGERKDMFWQSRERMKRHSNHVSGEEIGSPILSLWWMQEGATPSGPHGEACKITIYKPKITRINEWLPAGFGNLLVDYFLNSLSDISWVQLAKWVTSLIGLWNDTLIQISTGESGPLQSMAIPSLSLLDSTPISLLCNRTCHLRLILGWSHGIIQAVSPSAVPAPNFFHLHNMQESPLNSTSSTMNPLQAQAHLM